VKNNCLSMVFIGKIRYNDLVKGAVTNTVWKGNTIMKKSIGQNNAYYRKKMGITQEGLAEKMNVTSQAVSKWENDLSYPDPEGLRRLASVFDITMDALFKGEDAVVPVKEALSDEYGKRVLVFKILASDETQNKKGRVILRFPVSLVLRMAEVSGGLESLFGEDAPSVKEAIELIKNGTVGCIMEAESGSDASARISLEVIDYDN